MSTPTLRILLVEDHPDVASTFAAMLRQEGHTVRVARHAKAARMVAQNERFDLLLCDVNLADDDGCRLLEALLEEQSLKGIAIGSGGLEEETRCKAAGFVTHIAKPFVMETFWSAIDSVASKVAMEKIAAAAATIDTLDLPDMLDADVQFT